MIYNKIYMYIKSRHLLGKMLKSLSLKVVYISKLGYLDFNHGFTRIVSWLFVFDFEINIIINFDIYFIQAKISDVLIQVGENELW